MYQNWYCHAYGSLFSQRIYELNSAPFSNTCSSLLRTRFSNLATQLESPFSLLVLLPPYDSTDKDSKTSFRPASYLESKYRDTAVTTIYYPRVNT